MRVLDGKCAVVTSGSRGIGRAIVERMASDGAAVVFNYGAAQGLRPTSNVLCETQAAGPTPYRSTWPRPGQQTSMGSTSWSANNQLDDPETAEELHARGITWAPDTIVSAGGVIHAVAIERERATAQQAHQRVLAIGDTLTILTEARSRGLSPARAAHERAFILLTQAPRPGRGAPVG